jgi:hypothetical protein
MSLATIIRDTAPSSQALEGSVFGPDVLDGPDPDEFTENVPEVLCLACQAPVAPFESLGGDLAHYIGDPMNDHIVPYETDHAPFVRP